MLQDPSQLLLLYFLSPALIFSAFKHSSPWICVFSIQHNSCGSA